MAPSDSLTVLTTLFGVAITITVFVVAIVSWVICHERQSASVSGPAHELAAEPGSRATGLAIMIIVVLLLAGAVAAGQIVHWAWA